MTRFEFIAELRARLVALTNEEREAAVKYYDEFFEDAGPENEQNIIKDLVSPQKVAEQILEDYNRTEKSSTEYIPVDPKKLINVSTGNQNNNQNNYYQQNYQNPNTNNANTSYSEEPKQNSALKTVLIILLVIFASPILIGIAGALFGIFIAIISVIFSIWIAIGATVLGMTVGGVVSVIGGIVMSFTNPLAGAGVIGAGLIVLGFGLLLLVPFLWLTVKAIPAMFKWTIDSLSSLFNRKRKAIA